MMVPVGRLMVLRTTPKPELVRAIAYLTWPALIAPVVAPAVGGVLSTYASWRWIFLINLPWASPAWCWPRGWFPTSAPSGPTRWTAWLRAHCARGRARW